MKKIMFMLLCLMLSGVVFAAVADSTGHVYDPSTIPGTGATWHEWGAFIISALFVIWETIVRLIPTANNWSIASWINKLLDFLAMIFNGVGNRTKMADGSKGVFTTTKKSV